MKNFPAGDAKQGKTVNLAKKSAEIQGYLDKVEGLRVTGWAFDRVSPDMPVEVDIVVDKELVERTVADIFRADLVSAGFGDGRHSFVISLPAQFADDKSHEVSVWATASGVELSGSPFQMRYAERVRGKIEGTDEFSIFGWVINEAAPKQQINVSLFDATGELAQVVASEHRSDGSYGFRLPIPWESMDGQPHCFDVKATITGERIGVLPAITPRASPPWARVTDYMKSLADAALAPQAASRYSALQSHITEIVDGNSAQITAKKKLARIKELLQVHRHLVRGFSTKFQPISFPKVTNPEVSIVIPAFSKFALTYRCLASLLFAPNKVAFEVVMVDDASTDETADIESIVSGIEVVRHDKNQNFLKSCNDGVRKSRGRFVVILNNDTEVTGGWLDELIDVFESYPKVGLAGPKLLHPDGRLQDAGGIVWGNGEPSNYGRDGNSRDPRFNYVRQVDYLSGACLMIPRALWDELGGFDEEFCPLYFEDADLAYRVRRAGHKVVYTPLSEVYHDEGGTAGKSISAGAKRYQEVNHPKFKARWAQEFRLNGRPDERMDYKKERGIDFRVLFIDHEFPEPDKDAGSHAAVQEIRLFQSLGFKVSFLPHNLAYSGDYTRNLMRMGVESIFAPFWRSMDEFLEKRGREFDLVYIKRYAVAANCMESIGKWAPQAKVMLNLVDLHFLRELRASIASKDEALLKDALRTRDEELRIMRGADLVLSYTDVERAVVLSHNLESTRTAKCPWVVTPRVHAVPFAERGDIAFLGGFRHPPNVEAALYFATKIMPLLRKDLPDARFLVYGSNLPDEVKSLECDDIVIKGFVDDTGEIFASCRVFVAPLLSGAGIKGKVIECLANGVPSVLSPIAAEGIGVRHSVEAMIADSPKDWAKAIGHLYSHENRWEAMSHAALQFVTTEFAFEKGREVLRDALAQVDLFPATELEHFLYATEIRNKHS